MVDTPQWYELRVESRLGTEGSASFEGLSIRHTAVGETVLSGRMDQAALHGALMRIRDLGLVLTRVQREDVAGRAGADDD